MTTEARSTQRKRGREKVRFTEIIALSRLQFLEKQLIKACYLHLK